MKRKLVQARENFIGNEYAVRMVTNPRALGILLLLSILLTFCLKHAKISFARDIIMGISGFGLFVAVGCLLLLLWIVFCGFFTFDIPHDFREKKEQEWREREIVCLEQAIEECKKDTNSSCRRINDLSHAIAMLRRGEVGEDKI